MQLIVLLLTIVYAHELYFVPRRYVVDLVETTQIRCKITYNNITDYQREELVSNRITDFVKRFNPYDCPSLDDSLPMCGINIQDNTYMVNETWLNSVDSNKFVCYMEYTFTGKDSYINRTLKCLEPWICTPRQNTEKRDSPYNYIPRENINAALMHEPIIQAIIALWLSLHVYLLLVASSTIIVPVISCLKNLAYHPCN